jgi:predicted GNAT family N-acyltransferase
MDSRAHLDEYERLLAPARERFAARSGLKLLESPTIAPALMESFLLHFCAIGTRMTELVESWLHRSAERCEIIGLPELARALERHARAEAGHHLMMIADVRSLAARWNACRQPPVDAEEFLCQPPTIGALRYCQLHEENIISDRPYAQIAIEYEIEMLSLGYGERLIARCVELLGADVLSCLSFLTEHVNLDVGHTRFNARELGKLIEQDPTRLPTLVTAGTAALDAYAMFLADCAQLAERHAQAVQSSIAPSLSLSWQVGSPPITPEKGEPGPIPDWVEDVRALRGSVLYSDGRRPQFKTADGRCYDPDPIDLHAYHVLAYSGHQLVGCVRVYPLVSDAACCATEAILGKKRFAEMLLELGAQRTTTVEIGRWVVHPEHRKSGAGVWLAAGAATLAKRLGFQIAVCSAGTADKQDRILARMGMKTLPTVGVLKSDAYADRVSVMYVHVQNLKFVRIMDQMAETLGLNYEAARPYRT